MAQAAQTFAVLKRFIDIPAEKWTESPESESDDDESEIAAVLRKCDDPAGTDDDKVEVRVMSLKEVREAAAGVLLYLEENKSS